MYADLVYDIAADYSLDRPTHNAQTGGRKIHPYVRRIDTYSTKHQNTHFLVIFRMPQYMNSGAGCIRSSPQEAAGEALWILERAGANGCRIRPRVDFGERNPNDLAMLRYFTADPSLWNKWTTPTEIMKNRSDVLSKQDGCTIVYKRRAYDRCSTHLDTAFDTAFGTPSLDLRSHPGLIYMQTPPAPQPKKKKTGEPPARYAKHYNNKRVPAGDACVYTMSRHAFGMEINRGMKLKTD